MWVSVFWLCRFWGPCHTQSFYLHHWHGVLTRWPLLYSIAKQCLCFQVHRCHPKHSRQIRICSCGRRWASRASWFSHAWEKPWLWGESWECLWQFIATRAGIQDQKFFCSSPYCGHTSLSTISLAWSSGPSSSSLTSPVQTLSLEAILCPAWSFCSLCMTGSSCFNSSNPPLASSVLHPGLGHCI